MKNIVCYSFTEKGKELGKKIAQYKKYAAAHFHNAETDGGIKALLSADFKTKDALIFISSAGIAVRMIKDLIKTKTTDPAVIVINDTGKFVIPLLSGHVGGANRIAAELAAFIGGQCIITTASDNRSIEAVDLFAQKNGYTILSQADAKKITQLMVNGKTVGFYFDEECAEKRPPAIDYPDLIFLSDKPPTKAIDGTIIISKKPPEKLPAFLTECSFVLLVPRTLNVGIGLKKGAGKTAVKHAVEKALASVGKNIGEIRALASIDIKKEENGLIEFAKEINAALFFFSADAIKRVEDKFSKSLFVKKTVGVYNVSAPCACLLGGTVILDKFKYQGVTVSVSE